ncbi:uncharacterized protein J7T54_002006 [Emericellopsis cladophorae]|uniref:Uncharacterized protein n=1 Tax=Emericellopsis cladophorae TaxID=2686198 RepID=A0A9P9Y3J6_9HYPO|nr:uncharacterized protein J7T54_002006 [Emericellopsis cladophorae]KAI6782847.1 hypothetical protein J7T54_002006 [Emericellopsis cladophorae]
MRKALYDVEFDLNLFDADMDNSDLSKEFSERKRRLPTATSLMEDLDFKSATNLLVAVDSFRVADYASQPSVVARHIANSTLQNAVLELGRRLHSPKHLATIFEKYGALDGSTPYSVRTAFRQFATIPAITGENFSTLP